MERRTRTQKKLAQRLDLNYFKKTFPIPRWRRILSIALTAVGLGWLAWSGFGGGARAFTAGPVSHAHAMIKCAACHAAPAMWGTKVTDTECKACHDGPKHHDREMLTADKATPECKTCHVDHQGQMRLAATKDDSCTQCHASLQDHTKGGQPKYEKAITGFAEGEGHPEFALIRNRDKVKDPGTIKFNHFRHLEDLRIQKKLEKLECADCHRTTKGSLAEWKWADKSLLKPAPSTRTDHRPQRDFMSPIKFEEHCSNGVCHPLVYSDQTTEPAPHRVQPAILQGIVREKFVAYIAAHPDELALAMRQGIGPDPRLPNRKPPPPPRNAAEWVSQKMDDAETLLYRKTCKECHTLERPDIAKPPVIPTSIMKERWMDNAVFAHTPHQMVKCQECHAGANSPTEGQDTFKILMPEIKTCRSCHSGGGSQSADSRCSECHVYHDWQRQAPINGKFTTTTVKQ